MNRTLPRIAACAAAVSLLAACAGLSAPPGPAVSYSVPAQPEGSSGYSPKPGWATTRFAVAAANPLAVEAAFRGRRRPVFTA